ncbi:MAG: hypothetical protein B7733_06920 [Myxococcales bacterium FL481]|nr:MAG: hypothetical protein B7733_06920 [Myxococcales bacterium FL481]
MSAETRAIPTGVKHLRPETFAELKRHRYVRVGFGYLVASWFVLQITDVVFPMFGLADAEGIYVLAVLVGGFPLALFAGWVLGSTVAPSGVDSGPSGEFPQGTRRRQMVTRGVTALGLGAAAAALLLRLATVGPPGLPDTDAASARQSAVVNAGANDEVPDGAPQVRASPGGAAPERSVAVLPFVNLSPDSQHDFLSDGLTETLLHMLAQLPDLKVAARTSVFAFKGKNLDVRTVGEQLGVRTVLEGSVQGAGSKVRVTAQLIEAASGFHLWSQTFDRTIDDIFVVQDEIAENVATALRATLLENGEAEGATIRPVGTTSTAAYLKYLEGLSLKAIASYASLPAAANLFQEALALDPHFTEAREALAGTYVDQAETGLITDAQCDEQARIHLEQLRKDAPDNGRARGLLALLDLKRAGRSSDGEALLDELRAAVAQSPQSSELYRWLAWGLAQQARFEEALTWIERGLRVDPLSGRLHWEHGLRLAELKRFAEAEAAQERVRELLPQWSSGYLIGAELAVRRGDLPRGVELYKRGMQLDRGDHEIPVFIAELLYRLRHVEAGDRLLERARAIAPWAPTVRVLELKRAIVRAEFERASTLAANLLTEDVENRRGTYVAAVLGYASAMRSQGRAEEIVPFLSRLEAATPSRSGDSTSFKRTVLGVVTMGARRPDELTPSQRKRALAQLEAELDAHAPRWRGQHWNHALFALARGEREQAIRHVLEDLDHGVGPHADWEYHYLHLDYMSPIRSDPRVAERLEQLDEATRRLASEMTPLLPQLL